MKNLEQLQKNIVGIRKKRADLLNKIDLVRSKNETSVASAQSTMLKEIRDLEAQRDREIAQHEKERDEKLNIWKKTRENYLSEKNRYWRQLKKTFTDSYIPTARKLDIPQVKALKASLDKGGWFKEKYSKALYCAYKDAILYADGQMEIIKYNAAVRIDRATRECEARIAEARGNHGSASIQANNAYLQELWKCIEELENYDDSKYLWDHYRPLQKNQKDLRARKTDWKVYTPAGTLPEKLFLGSVRTSFPAVPDKKKKNRELGMDSWALRNNEVSWELPLYLSTKQSNLVILSSDKSFSQADSPDKVLARQLLAQQLKAMPPKAVAWSVMDPVHKGTSLGRLIDAAGTNSMELHFGHFTDKKSCAQERQRLVDRPQEIVEAMAGHCSSLYEYNASHADSPFPFVWYTDFGFMGKHEETEAIRELLTTAQSAGTSFLFATTSQGAQALTELAKTCARTLPVVCIDCDKKTVSVNGGRGESYIAADGPDKHDLDAFVAAVKARFTVDMTKETALLPTLSKNKCLVHQTNTTTLKLPYAINSRQELMYLTLDGKGDAFAYICGQAGSGKTVLLHTLILGACLRYLPGDLELWLADFKKDELRHYHEHPIPLITLVAAGEDPDLSYSLVDRLEREMERRSRLFARFPLVKDLDGYQLHQKESGYEKIPVLLVIIDEFSVMSAALEKDAEYKKKLERIFRQGRSRGIRLVLSDQTYGLRGLTKESLAQINVRIALKNTMEYISSTLQIKESYCTEAEKKTLEGMEPGDLMVRQFVQIGMKREPRLEKCRGLYTTVNDLAAIAAMLRTNLEKYMKVKSRPPVYVDEAGEKRTVWNPKDMLELERQDPVPEYGVRLYLGRGYGLKPCFNVDLDQEGYQNLSIVGGSSFQRWEAVRAVLLSCRRNGYTPLVFLPRGSNLKRGEKDLRALCKEIPGAKLMERYEDWCSQLLKLKQRMKNLEDTGETLCIFLNLELAAEDFQGMPHWREDNVSDPVPTNAGDILNQISADPVPGVPKPAEKVFDAIPLIREILKSGYRSNLYTVVEIGAQRDFYNVFKDNSVFRHRIAFDMSAGDMQAYLVSKQDHDNLAGSELAMYFGGGSRLFKLLPYQAPEKW